MISLSSLSGGCFFLALLGFALLLMLLLPRLKMGAALLSALCCMLFASYVGVILLEGMSFAAHIILWGGLIALAIGLVLLALGRRNLRSRVFTVPFWAYLALSALFLFLTYGRVIGEQHDSYSFWARAVKELFTFDRSYFQAGNNMSHMDYIPMAASLQYCIVRVFGWQDAFLTYVPIACVLVGICAAADFIPKKRYAILLCALALLYYPSLRLDLTQLTADGPLSMIFWGGLLCLCNREDGELSSLLPTLCAIAILPGLKIYTGLLFGAVLIILLLLGAWRKGNSPPALKEAIAAREDSARLRVPIRFAIIACCFLLFTHCSWSGYYHFHIRQMAYEDALAQADYENRKPLEALEKPSPTLRDLFAGNPRTSSLSSALTPGRLQQVGELICTTGAMYWSSPLPFSLLFLLPIFWTLWKGPGKRKRQARALLLSLLAAGVLYTLGLFAGYFVQSEIHGSAIAYLSTVHTPLILTAIFLCVQSISTQWDSAGKGSAVFLLLALLALPAFFHPKYWPTPLFQPAPATDSYANHAKTFWNEEISGLLTEQDSQSRVVLMDATWEANEIKSKSGITHAYQYFALPLRVFVYQFEYGNYEQTETITLDFLEAAVTANRSNLLILRTDDMLFEDAFAMALDLETDAYMPWVFDVSREGGELVFTLRNQEE